MYVVVLLSFEGIKCLLAIVNYIAIIIVIIFLLVSIRVVQKEISSTAWNLKHIQLVVQVLLAKVTLPSSTLRCRQVLIKETSSITRVSSDCHSISGTLISRDSFAMLFADLGDARLKNFLLDRNEGFFWHVLAWVYLIYDFASFFKLLFLFLDIADEMTGVHHQLSYQVGSLLVPLIYVNLYLLPLGF